MALGERLIHPVLKRNWTVSAPRFINVCNVHRLEELEFRPFRLIKYRARCYVISFGGSIIYNCGSMWVTWWVRLIIQLLNQSFL